jgi:hypothetical protein
MQLVAERVKAWHALSKKEKKKKIRHNFIWHGINLKVRGTTSLDRVASMILHFNNPQRDVDYSVGANRQR